MIYIHRAVEEKILKSSGNYPVVMVCGLRQAGKSTMLKELAKREGRNRKAVSLRDPGALDLALKDPLYFFEKYPPPVMIDEIQLAPSILPTIQYLVDEKLPEGKDGAGMFWLTCPQKFTMMKNVTESLVGRCTLFNVSSLSSAELWSRDVDAFDPDADALKNRASGFASRSTEEIFQRICLGSMPRLFSSDVSREEYYSDFTDFYLMHDALQFTQIDKIADFRRFLSLMAASTGREINCYGMAKSLSLTSPTIKKWVSVLDALDVIRIIPPYLNNTSPKLVKASKFYFMDTGLCSYLCGLNTAEEIMRSDMAEALFETYAVSEIVKSCYSGGKRLDLYHYRDTDKNKVDLLIAKGEKIFPVEMEMSHLPAGEEKKLACLDIYGNRVQPATVICLCDALTPLGEKVCAFPVAAL